ncbi:MAG: hypothetical protein Kilf2KO_33560 [Rhodospirillales bacterium]
MATIFGTSGNDSRAGGSGDDVGFPGRNATDKPFGGSGRDFDFFGSTGNDSLFGGDRDEDIFQGGEGSENLFVGSGDDASFFGGEGADRLFGGVGIDSLFDGSGNDGFVVVSQQEVQVGETYDGGSGNDTLILCERAHLPTSFSLSSLVSVEFLALDGSSGAESLVGDASVFGGSHNDRLSEGSGSDSLFGDADDGFLVVSSQPGEVYDGDGSVDRLILEMGAALPQSFTLSNHASMEVSARSGTGGSDRLTGDDQVNLLIGDDGADGLFGFDGDGGSGADTLEPLSGNVNDLEGTPHSDFLSEEFVDRFGASGSDSLAGAEGGDRLMGASGDDLLRGFAGDDYLVGVEGEDRLEGGGGDDTLLLSSGDRVFGSSGRDSFRFDGNNLDAAGSGGPLVSDFDGASLGAGNGTDKLAFATGLETGSFTYVGDATFSGGGNSEARFDGNHRVQVDHDGDGTVDVIFRIEGLTNAGQLTATDFIWL